jgi:hypothetical protein
MTALLSRLLSIALRNDTGRTACRLYGLVSTGAPPGTRTPNPRIKSRLGFVPANPYSAGQSVDRVFRPDSWRNPMLVFPSGAGPFAASEHTRSTHNQRMVRR